MTAWWNASADALISFGSMRAVRRVAIASTGCARKPSSGKYYRRNPVLRGSLLLTAIALAFAAKLRFGAPEIMRVRLRLA
jgi:hypothetical protein